MQINFNTTKSDFSGRLIIKGNATGSIRSALENNPIIKKMILGEKDLLANIGYREASKDEIYILGKEPDLYKVSFKFIKPVKNFWHRLENIFTKKYKLTKNYHSEQTTVSWLNDSEILESLFGNLHN